MGTTTARRWLLLIGDGRQSPGLALARYGAVLASCALALGAWLSFGRYLLPSPFPLFVAAVALGAWYGGLGPGLVATLGSVLATDYFFTPPLYAIDLTSPDNLAPLAAYSLLAALASWLHGRLRAADRRAEAARARAEAALTELRQARQRLVEQERLGALGQLAGGIAHDVNNALAQIIGYSELLLTRGEDLKDERRVIECVRLIHTAASDAASVVGRLRGFARRRDPDEALGPVQLDELVAQAISLTRPRWRDQALAGGIDIGVETDLQTVRPVAGSEVELRGALTNLILNAIDALPEGGTITLRTRVESEQAVVEVSDTGTGMTEEVRRRCLEPFFTTKGEHGTGLGLAMAYGILQRHGGALEIMSRPGEGTTIRLLLPIPGPEPPGVGYAPGCLSRLGR